MKSGTNFDKHKSACPTCERFAVSCPKCSLIAGGIFAAAQPRYSPALQAAASVDWNWRPGYRVIGKTWADRIDAQQTNDARKLGTKFGRIASLPPLTAANRRGAAAGMLTAAENAKVNA